MLINLKSSKKFYLDILSVHASIDDKIVHAKSNYLKPAEYYILSRKINKITSVIKDGINYLTFDLNNLGLDFTVGVKYSILLVPIDNSDQKIESFFYFIKKDNGFDKDKSYITINPSVIYVERK